MKRLPEAPRLHPRHGFLGLAVGLASNDIRRPFDPRRAESAGSLSVSLSVSLSNDRFGTAKIDSDSDSDSDSDQTPPPIVIKRFVGPPRGLAKRKTTVRTSLIGTPSQGVIPTEGA